MFRNTVHPLMALTLAAGLASDVGLGIAARIIGLGILGAAASARHGPYYYADDYGPECYRGRPVCRWSHRHCFENTYGDYVCRGGDYICERPLICE